MVLNKFEIFGTSLMYKGDKKCDNTNPWGRPRNISFEVEEPFFNPFLPTVPTFAVRETSVSRTANVGTVGMNGLI